MVNIFSVLAQRDFKYCCDRSGGRGLLILLPDYNLDVFGALQAMNM